MIKGLQLALQAFFHCRWEVGKRDDRPIRREDAGAHAAFFKKLSAADVHMRMLGAMRELSAAQRARFTQIDYAREMALIATRAAADGATETLGLARVVFDPDMVGGQFAIVVRSDLKQRCLGGSVFDCLLDYCREKGGQRIWGETLPENTAMQAPAASRGVEVTPAADGTVFMALCLAPAITGED